MRARDILPEKWSEKYKRSINCSNPKGFSQRAHCQGRKKDEDQHPNEKPRGPETKPTMPAGTVRVDVSDVYDWYKLGQHISNLKGLGKHDFGKGPPSTILSFGSEDEEHEFIQALQQIGLDITDIDPAYHDKKKGIKTDPTYNVGEAVVDLGETRQGAFNWLKSYLPTWPDYVLRDWLYRGLTKHDPNENPKEVIDRILTSEGMSAKTQWKLIPNFEFKIEKLHPDTQRRIKIRAGGSANPMNVPKDAERHATQAALAKKQGGVRKEPVIGKMTSQGFELIEGWHRTIQHFNQFPKGYRGPAWVATNATAESIDENFAESATLNELFDKPYPIEDWDEEPDMVQADFTTEDGNRIMITYKKITQTAWEIIFTIGYKDASGKFRVSFVKTGTGDAPRIFATVLNATAEFVKKHKPAYLYFGGKSDEPSRVALYKTMVRLLSGKMGFAPITAEQAPPDLQAHMDKYKDHTAFILRNKAAKVSENFADGKGPGRPGDSQRHGIPKGATIAQLEKAAKAKGRKGQLARWQLNMRRGKKK